MALNKITFGKIKLSKKAEFLPEKSHEILNILLFQ